MHTSSGACLSASLRKEVISSSFRASSERAWISPPAASISLTRGASFSPLRRPAKMVKPSAANFLAISPPMKSPAPITATVLFVFCKDVLPLCQVLKRSRPPSLRSDQPVSALALRSLIRCRSRGPDPEAGSSGFALRVGQLRNDFFLDVAQAVLSKIDLTTNEERGRTKGAACHRGIGVLDQLLLDVVLLGAGRDAIDVQPG